MPYPRDRAALTVFFCLHLHLLILSIFSVVSNSNSPFSLSLISSPPFSFYTIFLSIPYTLSPTYYYLPYPPLPTFFSRPSCLPLLRLNPLSLSLHHFSCCLCLLLSLPLFSITISSIQSLPSSSFSHPPSLLCFIISLAIPISQRCSFTVSAALCLCSIIISPYTFSFLLFSFSRLPYPLLPLNLLLFHLHLLPLFILILLLHTYLTLLLLSRPLLSLPLSAIHHLSSPISHSYHHSPYFTHFPLSLLSLFSYILISSLLSIIISISTLLYSLSSSPFLSLFSSSFYLFLFYFSPISPPLFHHPLFFFFSLLSYLPFFLILFASAGR